VTAIAGTCLCGAVQVVVPQLPREVTQCNCSVCRRYGTLWAYYAPATVSITAKRGGLASYARRARGLRFVRCATCGCVVCWKRPGKRGRAYMGVNTRLLDHAAMARVPVKVLDGDKTWKALGSYRRPGMWISPHR